MVAFDRCLCSQCSDELGEIQCASAKLRRDLNWMKRQKTTSHWNFKQRHTSTVNHMSADFIPIRGEDHLMHIYRYPKEADRTQYRLSNLFKRFG